MEQKVLRFIFTGKSNKKLDNLCNEVIDIIKSRDGKYSGPVRFKGKRLIDINYYDVIIISKLLKINVKKDIQAEIFELDDKYYLSKERNNKLKKLI